MPAQNERLDESWGGRVGTGKLTHNITLCLNDRQPVHYMTGSLIFFSNFKEWKGPIQFILSYVD